MILLDTQVAYWALTGSSRLGDRSRRLIESAAVRHVSTLTHAQFALAALAERLEVPDDLPTVLEGLGLTGLPFTAAHAQALQELPPLPDPPGRNLFGPMLLAQARAEGLSLITADPVLLQADRTIDATR